MQNIQISRRANIEASLAAAILRLNGTGDDAYGGSVSGYSFKKGEFVMINYYKDTYYYSKDSKDIAVLIVIGIKDGIGEGCYRIISTGSLIPVRNVKIGGNPQSVANTVHGETCIHQDDSGKWEYVKSTVASTDASIVTTDEQMTVLSGGTYYLYTRITEDISGGPYIYLSLSDGYRWFYQDQTCKREDDFYSKSELISYLQSYVNLSLSLEIACTDTDYSNYGCYLEGTQESFDLNLTAYNNGSGISEKIDNSLYKLFVYNSSTGGWTEIATPDENGNRLYTGTASTTTDYSFKLVYYITPELTVEKIETYTIHFGGIFYYGPVSSNWDEGFSSLKSMRSYDKNFTYQIGSVENKRLVFGYPLIYKRLSHIYDIHGLDYIHDYEETTKVWNNTDYRVYTMIDSVTIGDFQQIYAFNDSNNLESSESEILAVVDAWKRRSGPNGLVVLDENGKLPDIISEVSIASNATIPLASITIPKGGSSSYLVNQYYYDPDAKIVYQATGTSMTVDVEPGQVIYSYTSASENSIGEYVIIDSSYVISSDTSFKNSKLYYELGTDGAYTITTDSTMIEGKTYYERSSSGVRAYLDTVPEYFRKYSSSSDSTKQRYRISNRYFTWTGQRLTEMARYTTRVIDIEEYLNG